MRIAQVAPLIEAVPPRLYGGTERIVSYLTEALVAMGHEVTLFASGDSRTSARLVPCAPEALRLDPEVQDCLPHHLAMLEDVACRADSFDVLHFHLDLVHMPAFRMLAGRTVTTLHGRLDLPDLAAFYRRYPHMPLVSISNAQRKPMPPVRWLGTVQHGLPRDLLRPGPGGDYLAFLGRISPEKRPDRAIRIARAAGLPLKIAAKVDRVDGPYYDNVVRPLLNGHGVEFVGEIGEAEKSDFLGGARALLFPIDWPEPFGLVMIEAMACGTPVIAYECGSVPEVIENGVTGFVVADEDAAVRAVERAGMLDRTRIRARFEARFTAQRMAEDYVSLYEDLLAAEPLVAAAA